MSNNSDERRREFSRMKFDCLERVRADVAAHTLPDKALVLALSIIQHINEETLEGYPGQERLAGMVGASERTVRTLTDKLIEVGHFTIEKARSRLKTFRYRIAISGKPVNYGDNRKPASALDEVNRKPASALDEPKPEVSSTQTGSFEHPNRKFHVVKPEAGFRQTPIEHLQEHLHEQERAHAREVMVGVGDEDEVIIQETTAYIQNECPDTAAASPGYDIRSEIERIMWKSGKSFEEAVRTLRHRCGSNQRRADRRAINGGCYGADWKR